MSPPRKAGGPKLPASLRFTSATLELIDEARGRRGWTRQEWFDRLVERGLQGEGLVPAPVQKAAPARKIARSKDVTPMFKTKDKDKK